jgi:hypothetical protein
VFTATVNATTGQYEFTLSGPIDHAEGADNAAIEIGFTVTDGDGDPVDSSFTVDVTDDTPTTTDDSATVQDGLDSINLVIMFDRSRSMDQDPNVEGFSTRLDLARAAIASLLKAYETITDINILIVDFAGTPSPDDPSAGPVDIAANSGWLTTVDEAVAYLAGLQAAGTTNYEAAVTETMSAYAGAPTAEETVVYFLSDGNPTSGGRGNQPGTQDDYRLTDAQIAAWENFLTTNGIEKSFAVGIGQDINNLAALEDIATPNVDGDNNPIIVTEEGQLFTTLLITVDGNASGNVTTNDDFGADGEEAIKIASLTVDGHVYAYDGVNITRDGLVFQAATATLVLATVLGGTLSFNFLTGEYDYVATAAGEETFTYTIIDGDGDTDSGQLVINIGDDGLVKPNLVVGNDGNNTLVTNGDDTRADIVSGGDGNDHLTGDGSNDMLIGGAGIDALFGGAGSDVLIGGTQSRGKEFPPVVRPGGADGSDYLDGGEDSSADYLFGGHGSDILVVRTLDEAHGDVDDDLFVLHDNVNFGLIDGGGTALNSVTKAENNGPVSLAGSFKGDTVTFNGSLDLTAIANGKITGIETISMLDSLGNTNHSIAGSISHFAAGADTLTLNAADVISMGTGVFDPEEAGYISKDAIKVDGDAGDTLNLTGGGWVNLGADANAGGYTVWAHDPSGAGTNEDAYVLVSNSITVNAS